MSYMFIKYKKKIKDISFKYIDINNSIYEDYKYSLFCINTGGGNYSFLNFYKAKLVMNYLFPILTPYENIDYDISYLAFNVVKSLETTLKLEEKKFKNIIRKNNIFRLETLIVLFIFVLFIKIKKNKIF